MKVVTKTVTSIVQQQVTSIVLYSRAAGHQYRTGANNDYHRKPVVQRPAFAPKPILCQRRARAARQPS